MTSARTAERLARILSMLPWVIAHPGALVDDVATRFGYDRDELVKDLNLVFVCGLPGYGPGDLMDAYLDDDEVVVDMADYFSRPLRLTAPEALMMLAGGMAMLSAAPNPALQSAVDKLARVLLPEEGALDVDLGPEPELVTSLREAATERRVVTITYSALSSGTTTTRDVEPWVVFSSLGNWYVSGHCRLADGERLFRIDRIKDLTVLDESFTPPVAEPEARVRYSPGVEDSVVRLRLGEGARWVTDYYPVEVVAHGESGTVIDFSAADPMATARLLLRLGGEAEVVGGPDADTVTATVESLRGSILRRYE